ncbi:NrfD/PsrC family molybdoenzyme membrane anchor subunit [Desulfosporosinus lacus]|uniref:Prokaryotic molybdopterin-containing oxidoreductase family, membrane subunit n=1 Tax=Desulfosporosinus lacus DSM 15449 TaxID=1121420 RepID=A0A1M5YL53_9FIRM|nr:NrfD/PsrC family molybdoenzyme membrane anchor subunit [Desulfosporosinus lacus]SHI12618.1 prokaryotic molybdopterin-containing oxidoreductase family, membrane subunit [Desulfosporosinus lacus DSM 15449]
MKKSNILLGLAGSLILISLVAWGYQIYNGLIVTNMRNSFSWGLYIATFAFFVGVAAGGLIVSSTVYLFNIEKLKPFTRIASLSAFASILGAGAMILPDMGRVDRIWNIFVYPNFRSPLVWDVIVISAYLLITFLSVYVQLLPDRKKEGSRFLNGWTKAHSQEEVEAFSKKWSKRIALVGLPVAILIHTVTALIFATQASRGWWNTAVLPPDFVSVAVASGTALVLVIALLAVGKEQFDQHKGAFQIMALIVAGSLVVHFFFVSVDLIIHGWWGSTEAKEILSLIFGHYRYLYATELLFPAFTMVLFFTEKGKRSYRVLMIGSVLLFIGVFAHRLMLMFPAFNAIPLSLSIPGAGIESWAYPVALGQLQEGMPVFVSSWAYTPTLVEYGVTLLPFGLVLFVVTAALKMYNFLPQKRSM